MKYVFLVLLLVGCSHSPVQERRENILDCTKDLITYDAYPVEAYMVCKDLHTRQPRVHQQVIEVPGER